MSLKKNTIVAFSSIFLLVSSGGPALAADRTPSIEAEQAGSTPPETQPSGAQPLVEIDSPQNVSDSADGAAVRITSEFLSETDNEYPVDENVLGDVPDIAGEGGAQRIFTLTQPSAATPVELNVDTGETSTLVAQEAGQVLIQNNDAEGQSLGTLNTPIATDRHGVEVPLEVSAAGNKVTYNPVGVPADSYPVTIASGWTYTLTYSWQNSNWPAYVSYDAAIASLRGCFNCSFPIPGANATFPVNGEVLPLVAAVGPVQRNAPVEVFNADASTGTWSFRALPGHFDTPGSTVQFNIFQGRDLEFVLGVSANVLGSDVPQSVNTAGAQHMWATFALNLCRNSS